MMATETLIPKSLPPPYTATGTQSSNLRTNASNFGTTAELLIGPKPTRYLLHTSLLVSQSPYFRAALNGAFLESTAQSISLPDITDTQVFELLVSWLYTGDISPLPFKGGKPAYYTLLNLYALADRLCFEGLRNRIVDVISDLADTTNSVLTPSDTRILYEALPPSAPLRTLVLDLFAFKKTDKLLSEHEDRWHAGFLRDLCVLLKRPCEQAVSRHRLCMWYPSTYAATHACENCRSVIPPRYGAVRCEDCFVAWCPRCVGEGVGMPGWEDGNPGRFVRVRNSPSHSPASPSSGHSRGSSHGSNGSNVSIGRDSGIGLEGEGQANGNNLWENVATEILPNGKKVRIRKWQSCKPWRGSRCTIYHEHKETDRCGDVFMGR